MIFSRITNPRKSRLRSYQKVCPRCQRIVHADVQRCPSCAHAPWIWHPNFRLLAITLLVAIAVLLLIRPLTMNEPTSRVPMMAPSSEQ